MSLLNLEEEYKNSVKDLVKLVENKTNEEIEEIVKTHSTEYIKDLYLRLPFALDGEEDYLGSYYQTMNKIHLVLAAFLDLHVSFPDGCLAALGNCLDSLSETDREKLLAQYYVTSSKVSPTLN